MTSDTNRRQVVQPEAERSLPTRARGGTESHWQLTVVLALFVCLASAYSLMLPLGEAADETDHFALVRFIAEHGRPPLTIEERHAIGPKGDASPIYHGLVALLTQQVDVSALPALPDTQARPERFIPTDGFRANRIFHTEDEAFPFRGIVLAWHLARLVSIPLGAATVVAAYITALAIYPHRRYFALAVASFVAFLPRFVIGSAVVNDDNLVVPVVAFSVYCLVRVAQGDESRRTFIVLGALMGGAAIAKYHSLVLVPELIVVLAVLAWRDHRKAGTAAGDGPSLLGRLGWSLLAFGLVAGWWFAFLMIQFNQVAELGWIRGLMAPLGDPVVTTGLGRVLDLQPGGTPSYEFGWGDWADLFFRSFWVSYAWLHVFATPIVYWILGFLCVVALLGLLRPVWGLVFPARKPSRQDEDSPGIPPSGWRLDVAVLALHLFVYLTVIVMRYLLRPARETGQGRHLYPALTSVAFFFTLGLANSWEMIRWSLGVRPDNRPHPESTGLLKGEAGLALGIGGALFSLSLLALPVFILPEYHPYLSIVTARPADVTIPHRLSVRFADGLELAGYRVDKPEVRAGDPVSVTLYWYADARQERDYLVEVCLGDDRDQMVTCRRGHPIDGRYPMRAWEVGYLIRDQVDVPTPDCVPAGDYELVLSLLPLRLGTANTAVDWQSAQRLAAEGHNPVSLGKVTLMTAPGTVVGNTQSRADGFDLWIRDKLHGGEEIVLDQMRQQLTVITYRPARSDSAEDGSDTGGGDASPVRLVPAGGHTQAIPDWLPVAHFPEETSRLSYDCPAGHRATTYNFILDPAVRPGRYHLAIGDEVQDDWPIDVATRFRDFSPPSDIPYRLDASFVAKIDESPPRLQLLGYDMDLSPRWPGDVVPITAYWQSHQTMSQHYVVSFYLLDPMMQPWGQVDWTLGGHYPSVLWAPGENVEEVHLLPINAGTPPGLYSLQLSVCQYEAPTKGKGFEDQPGELRFLLITASSARRTAGEQLYLGSLRVMDPAETIPPSQPMAIELGGEIRLLGYDLSCPENMASADCLNSSEKLHLALHWQPIGHPTADYTVFTQLIGPDGLVWGQQDNQPQAGRYPTTSWNLRDKVVDRYDLELREGAPVGEYRLIVGMYDLKTGQRLAAVDKEGNHLADDAIMLTTINVE